MILVLKALYQGHYNKNARLLTGHFHDDFVLTNDDQAGW